jgi:hypothetical protein
LDDRLLAMDRNRLRLDAGKLGSSAQTSCGMGGRPLGASARRLGLDCRPLAVKQQDTADWHLWEDTNLTLSSASAIATFRIRLLWAHGTILTLVALGSAAATTMGWMIGIGPFGFMQQKPLVWVGLIQAYLLMTIIAVLLILGASQANTKKWHIVGALAHGPPLLAAFSSLDLFASMGVLGVVWIPITFHMVFLTLETFAALYPQHR